MKSIKCLIGLHEYEKLGGASNVGGGKFKFRYVCKKCKKIKTIIK